MASLLRVALARRAPSTTRVAAMRMAVAPAAVRCFGALTPQGGKVAAPTDLASVLKKEIDYEAEEGGSETQLASIAQSLYTASGFKLEDTRGTSRFVLTRSADGKEVRVEVDCTPVPTEEDNYDEEEGEEEKGEEEEEEEQQGEEGYRALISVTDPATGQVLQAGAFVTDQLRLQRVTLFEAGKAPSADSIFAGVEETTAYGGPVFDELDETLQNAFYDYLAGKGVDDELAGRVADYCSSKEQVEYVGWLKGVQAFAKGK